MPFWRWVGGDEVRSFHDWVEIANLTDEPLELSEYYLSDKEKDRLLYRLPEKILEPGECAVVLCDKELDVGAPFGLSGEGEQLYLSRADGSLCDYAALHDIPWGMSQGRSGDEGGAFYFSEPSPGEKNEGGARLRASMPVAAEPDGVFENVRSVTVTLKGKGEIRYTLDGTEPTGSSLLYEGPITLKETAAVRAACFMPDRLRSEVLDLCYILNEGHSFPVAAAPASAPCSSKAAASTAATLSIRMSAARHWRRCSPSASASAPAISSRQPSSVRPPATSPASAAH